MSPTVTAVTCTFSSVTINVQFIRLHAKRKNTNISKWSLDISNRCGEKSLSPSENRCSTAALAGSVVFSRTCNCNARVRMPLRQFTWCIRHVFWRLHLHHLCCLCLLAQMTERNRKTIGVEYCQKTTEQYRRQSFRYCRRKYRRYLRQYSKCIANTIGSSTNTAILTTQQVVLCYFCIP